MDSILQEIENVKQQMTTAVTTGRVFGDKKKKKKEEEEQAMDELREYLEGGDSAEDEDEHVNVHDFLVGLGSDDSGEEERGGGSGAERALRAKAESFVSEDSEL